MISPLCRKIIFIVFLFPVFSHCQTSFGVWGKIKPDKSIVLIYSNFDTAYCHPDFRTSDFNQIDKEFYIVDDVICYGKTRPQSYISVINNKLFFIEASTFQNIADIDNSLLKLKTSVPDIDLRIAHANEEISKRDKQKLIEIKIRDSLILDSMKALHIEVEKLIKNYAATNRVIWNWSWDYENEYSLAIDFNIKIFNPYRKKIKYTWITFKAFNAVDDPAFDEITHSPQKTVRGIGPIEYSETGTYTFERALYSKVVDYVKITQIKLQFFDGTIKIIPNPKSLGIED